jgi:multidrug efflux system outer membrane protein
MTRPRVHLVPAAIAVLLAGCSLAPPYERPEPAIPAQWPRGDAYAEPGEAAAARLDLRQLFADPELIRIVELALANNQDVRLAAANVAAVRAQYDIQRAQRLPRVDGSASVSAGERSERASSSGGGGADSTVYQAGIGVTAFELDFFGRVRSLSEAALQEYFATEAAERTTRIALVAEIANVYLSMAADRSLLAIAQDTVRVAERSVELTRARLKGGVAPRSDVRQAQTVLAQAESDLAELTTSVARNRNALRLLVGADVTLPDDAASIETMNEKLAEIPAGLDSGVLLHRPDVRQAEHQLRAANARIGAARAAFFPRISLTAAAGLASASLSSLFSAGAFAWSVQPALLVPIFDGGANEANLEATLALREAATARYQKTIQTAFREVADALARRGTIDRQFDAQTRLVDAATDNLTLVEARYRQGIESFLGTLDAQRTLYAARRSLVQTWLVRAQNRVALYRALGQPAE